MVNLKKILFIYPVFGTFVEADFKILSKHYSLHKFHFQQSKSMLSSIINQMKLIGWIIKNIGKAAGIYIWFADYHALFPVFISNFLGKKSFLVLAGYDVTYIKEIDYGSFKNPVRAFCARYAIKHATINMADADNIAEEAQMRVKDARIVTVYNGSDETKFIPSESEKENIVLTVAGGDSLQRFRLKGIDFFSKLAEKLPQYKFMVAGMTQQVSRFMEMIPPNLCFLGRIDEKELLSLYQKSKIYAQYSMREGLPTAVCEAMLCECIPVGFNTGGVAIAIGDCGYLTEYQDENSALKAIETAMAAERAVGRSARERVLKNFTLKIREQHILKLFKENE